MPAIDRTRRPPSQPVPQVMLPDVQRIGLSTGLSVWLVERHALPLLSIHLLTSGGVEREVPGTYGVATLAAELFDTGTGTRDLQSIARSLEVVGATMQFGSGFDATYGWISSLSRHIGSVLPVFAEAYTGPAFPEPEFERLRKKRLASILAQRDRPAAIASNAFLRLIYGGEHPYGRDTKGTEHSVASLGRNDAAEFHGRVCRPGASTLIAVGDISMTELLPMLEEAFGSWALPKSPAEPFPAPPEPGSRTITLIDKPDAPQSEIRIGYPALARSSPDYFAVLLMNRILGGQFSSRINLNLRERHGYTYGARSSFMFFRQPGPFMASGAFVTEHTADSVRELLAEITRLHDEGISEEELEFSRKGLSGSFALNFETSEQIAGSLQISALYGLPDDYYRTYLEKLGEVTGEDIRRVARRYLDADRMTIVVVGDAARVRGGLEQLGIGEVYTAAPDG
jgi:zinc protease